LLFKLGEHSLQDVLLAGLLSFQLNTPADKQTD